MKPNIQLDSKSSKFDAQILLIDKKTNLSKCGLNKQEIENVQTWMKKEMKQILFFNQSVKIVQIVDSKDEAYKTHEELRKYGNTLNAQTNKHKCKSVLIQNFSSIQGATYFVAEGMALGNYQFIQYKKDADKKENRLQTIRIQDTQITKAQIMELNAIIDASYRVKDLVNEPVNHLNAEG